MPIQPSSVVSISPPPLPPGNTARAPTTPLGGVKQKSVPGGVPEIWRRFRESFVPSNPLGKPYGLGNGLLSVDRPGPVSKEVLLDVTMLPLEGLSEAMKTRLEEAAKKIIAAVHQAYDAAKDKIEDVENFKKTMLQCMVGVAGPPEQLSDTIFKDSAYSKENFVGITVPEEGESFIAYFKNDKQLRFSNKPPTVGEFRGSVLQQALRENDYANLEQLILARHLTEKDSFFVFAINSVKGEYTDFLIETLIARIRETMPSLQAEAEINKLFDKQRTELEADWNKAELDFFRGCLARSKVGKTTIDQIFSPRPAQPGLPSSTV